MNISNEACWTRYTLPAPDIFGLSPNLRLNGRDLHLKLHHVQQSNSKRDDCSSYLVLLFTFLFWPMISGLGLYEVTKIGRQYMKD